MKRVAFAIALLATLSGSPDIRAQQATEPQTESVWSCPVHAVVNEQNPGKCPICRRDLVLVTATITWTCADHPEIDRPVRGKCADGSPMEKRYTQSTHANHNPRHGGLFFMAPDLWHHLEGAYVDGAMRVYLYDDYTKPLAPDLRSAVTGRIVTKETFDSATRTTKELSVFPLKLAADGEYLEAQVGRLKFPAELTAKLRFTKGGEEYRFDFTFAENSVDKSPSTVDAALLFEVPDDAAEVRRLLAERMTHIGDLVKKGAFGEVWVPAFQAKDLGLALDVQISQLAAAQRLRARSALERLIRAAWALDAAGDTGNRGDVEDAYRGLAEASREIEQLFAALPAKPGVAR
ncbi:MAG TPA: hypothetical protein VFP91_11310 [Vicinamibacterales bacterium]|nr:hypothetical protein [Vicinamibacterales bacterium]